MPDRKAMLIRRMDVTALHVALQKWHVSFELIVFVRLGTEGSVRSKHSKHMHVLATQPWQSHSRQEVHIQSASFALPVLTC